MWQSSFCRLLSHTFLISVFLFFPAMFCKKNLFCNLAKYFKAQRKNKLSYSVFKDDYLSTRSFIPCKLFFRCQTEIKDFSNYLRLDKYSLGYSLGCRNNFCNISELKCWNCKQNLVYSKFSCSACGALQYPKQNLNYFELLGISQMFDINTEDLSTKFRNLQMTFHPDKFANKPKEEQEISEIYSRLINKAYTTLKDSVMRGFYLLRLQKEPVNEYMTMEQDFLTQIMDKNEALENIKNLGSLKRFSGDNQLEIERQTKMISDAFLHRKWNEAKINLIKLNYLMNLDQKVKEKQLNFEIKE